jgi:hypothetical protein
MSEWRSARPTPAGRISWRCSPKPTIAPVRTAVDRRRGACLDACRRAAAERRRKESAMIPMSPIQQQIISEIVKALGKLGADSELMSTIGSMGETLEDEEVLQGLRDWNARGRSEEAILEEEVDPRILAYIVQIQRLLREAQQDLQLVNGCAVTDRWRKVKPPDLWWRMDVEDTLRQIRQILGDQPMD